MSIELPKLVRGKIEQFTGRTWLLPKVLDWWNRNDERILLLTGGPGTGKSMIIAWLAGFGPEPQDPIAAGRLTRLRTLVKAAHFCHCREITPSAFAENVANQLIANKVEGFAEALATLSPRAQFTAIQNINTIAAGGLATGIHIDLGALGDELSFDRGFIEPLKKFYASGHSEPVLLLVDALDEAQTYTGQRTLPYLLSQLDDFPSQVRILATTREEPRVLKLFRGIKPFDLIRNAPPDVDDVRMYTKERLTELALVSDSNRRPFAERLYKQADGVFLYAAMVLDELLERSIVEFPDLTTYPLPKGLSGLYREFLNRELGKDEQVWSERYRPLLGVIAVAQDEGLTIEQLTNIVKHDRDEVGDTLRRCKQYLSGDLPDGPFRPFHKSFADFLLEDKDNFDYHIDSKTAHQQIAEYFWDTYHTDWSKCPDYGLNHLASHLYHAGAAKRLYALLDGTWSRAKSFRFSSAFSFGKDLELAIDCAVEHNDLTELVKLDISFSQLRRQVPVPVLETLVLLGEEQRTADQVALLPSVSERIEALSKLAPLVAKRSGLAQAQRLFREAVLSASSGGSGCGPDESEHEIFALISVGETARARAVANAFTNDPKRFASAWLSVARAEATIGCIEQVSQDLEDQLKLCMTRAEQAADKVGPLSIVVLLMIETGQLDKACTWAEEALKTALQSPWSHDSPRALSAAVEVLNRSSQGLRETRVGELALRVALVLGSNAFRVMDQVKIVPWLIRSGREADAFALAANVRNPKNRLPDALRLFDESSRSHELAQEVLSEIARTLMHDLGDLEKVNQRMKMQLDAQPVLSEWADDKKICSLIEKENHCQLSIDDILAELELALPAAGPKQISRDRAEEEIRKFLGIAKGLVDDGRAQEATDLALRILDRVRGLVSKLTVFGAELYCEPEDVAIALIDSRAPDLAVKIASGIEACPPVCTDWRLASIAQALAQSGYSDQAREIAERVLSSSKGLDKETIDAGIRLLDKIATSLSAAGALQRSAQVAAAVYGDCDRSALFVRIAEDLVANGREEAAARFVEQALGIFWKALGQDVAEGDVSSGDDRAVLSSSAPELPCEHEPCGHVRWLDCAEWEEADWLDNLSCARRILLRVRADGRAAQVAGWIEQSDIRGDNNRTWAQTQVAEALVWNGKVERAKFLATQTDWDDFEAKADILRAVAVNLALCNQIDEAQGVLASIEGGIEKANAFIQAAADLVAAGYSGDKPIAWAEHGLEVAREIDGAETELAERALRRLIEELSEHGHIERACDVVGWIADPLFQANGWVCISEILLKKGSQSDARSYVVRALDRATAISSTRDRLGPLQGILEACVHGSQVPQATALLKRSLVIVNALDDTDLRAKLLAQVARQWLLRESPEMKESKKVGVYVATEITCAFANEGDEFVTVPLKGEGSDIAAEVAGELASFAVQFEARLDFAEMAKAAAAVVMNTLAGLEEGLLARLLSAARLLAGTASLPEAEAMVNRFVSVAESIRSPNARLTGLTQLVSAFAESGFPSHAVDIAEWARSAITDSDSSNFVSASIRAVDYMVASGHGTEAMRVLAIMLQAARWEKRVLFDALSGTCEALVGMERAEDLWSFFISVEPLSRDKAWQ
jgi:tetratricopeptide (TPR) repeat protein